MTSSPETITLDAGDDAVTVTATVTSMQRRTELGIVGTLVGLDAHLTITFTAPDASRSYSLSRLRGETHWIIDAEFGPLSMPRYVHGFGARYLKLKAIAPELADLLDREACRLGLAQAIGRNIPLVLPNDKPHHDNE
jgi:hypothetical protein